MSENQTPVAWLYIEPNNPHQVVHCDDADVSQFPHDEWFPVYKAQPKREWQGLTDAERSELWWATDMGGMPEHDYGKAVETKLKEKNHG